MINDINTFEKKNWASKIGLFETTMRSLWGYCWYLLSKIRRGGRDPLWYIDTKKKKDHCRMWQSLVFLQDGMVWGDTIESDLQDSPPTLWWKSSFRYLEADWLSVFLTLVQWPIKLDVSWTDGDCGGLGSEAGLLGILKALGSGDGRHSALASVIISKKHIKPLLVI